MGIERVHDRSTAFLDGLRGLAAFLVLVYHFNVGWYAEEIQHGYGENGHRGFPLLPIVRLFYTGGPAAVAIFFVLSGFVLTISPLRKIRDKKPAEQIYSSILSSVVRRPIRLYIPCLLFILTYATLRHTPMIYTMEWPPLEGDIFLEWIMAVVRFSQFFWPFRQHDVQRPFEYGTHYWTIPIELKGSMLVFGLTALLVDGVSPQRELLRLASLGLLFHQLGQWTMSLFVFGMCLAICEANNLSLDYPKHQAKLNWAFLVVGCLLCSQVEHNIEWSRETPGWRFMTWLIPTVYVKDEYFRYWSGYGAVLIVYAILRIEVIQNFFKLPVMVWLGKVSFVLYLSHTVVVFSRLGDWCRRVVGEPTFFLYGEMGAFWYDNKFYMPSIGPMGLNLRAGASFALVASCCLVIAHFGTNIYDRPGLKAARWFANILGLDKPKPDAKALPV